MVGVRSAAWVALFILFGNTAGFAQTAASTARTCTGAVLNACSELTNASIDASRDKTLALPVQRDGGIVFNSAAALAGTTSSNEARSAATEAQLRKIAQPSPARAEKALAVVKRVRAQALELITGGIAPNQQTAEQRTLIERLKTFDVRVVPNDNPLCSVTVPVGFPNAGYARETHTLELCPAALAVGELELTQFLVHEMGHVVEPCSTANPLLKVDKDAAYRGPLAECNKDFFYDENGEQLQTIDPFVGILMSQQPPYMNANLLREPFKTLIACGALTPVPNSNTPAPSFFKTTQACVAKNFTSAGQLAAERTATVRAKANHTKIAAERAKYRAENPQVCDGTYREQFADSFAAKLIGQMAERAAWTPNDFKVAFLDVQGYDCFEHASGQHLDDRYPPASYRMASILNDPSTRSRLNCKAPATTPSLCPLVMDGLNASSRAAAKPAPAKNVK